MKGKFLIIGLFVVALIVVGIFAYIYVVLYNDLVTLDEAANEKFAQVEQELQRRYDLIPRVVNASKLYIEYEGSILEEITRLRSQWATAMQSGNLSTINNATGELESTLARLIVVILELGKR